MSVYISVSVRQLVADRASNRCEYCKVHQQDTFFAFQIDHVVSLKHGGNNEIENLALACPQCNSYKGSDLATFVGAYHNIVPIFNPRFHAWGEHFEYSEGVVLARTLIGEATIKLLQFNGPDRIIQRSILEDAGLWP
ncbi:MAG: HNH endonuclease signature motif containing protein [Saprospiraceae bacterium]|nr:HNH endonuclease signature motif containing protein [Saprospiraceae bacterium]